MKGLKYPMTERLLCGCDEVFSVWLWGVVKKVRFDDAGGSVVVLIKKTAGKVSVNAKNLLTSKFLYAMIKATRDMKILFLKC